MYGNTTLALVDIKNSPGNYVARYHLAAYFSSKGDFDRAEVLAKESLQIYPTGTNWDVLGKVYMASGKYPEAQHAFSEGMKRQPLVSLYQDAAALSIVYGEPSDNLKSLKKWVVAFPENSTIWTALAVARYRTGDITGAKTAIATARKLNDSNASVKSMYDQITQNRPLILK